MLMNNLMIDYDNELFNETVSGKGKEHVWVSKWLTKDLDK
jgi:hypothetical protein